MKSAVRIAATALLVVALPAWSADDFHRLRDDSGGIAEHKCVACHNQDMSLSRTPTETCALCHTHHPHAGGQEHLRASAARVGLVAHPGLPLTEDGRMWCGTCHLPHPGIRGEVPQARGWRPARVGLAEAVRQGLVRHHREAAASPSSSDFGFAVEGARALRMPVDDGSLCLACHAELVR